MKIPKLLALSFFAFSMAGQSMGSIEPRHDQSACLPGDSCLLAKNIISEALETISLGQRIDIGNGLSLLSTEIITLEQKYIYHFDQHLDGKEIEGGQIVLVKRTGKPDQLLGKLIKNTYQFSEGLKRSGTNNSQKTWQDVVSEFQKDHYLGYTLDASEQTEIWSKDQNGTWSLTKKIEFSFTHNTTRLKKRPVAYFDSLSQVLIKQSEKTKYDRAAGSGPSGNPKTGIKQYHYHSNIDNKTIKELETFTVKLNEDLVKGKCGPLGVICDPDEHIFNNTCSMAADGVETINLQRSYSGDEIYTYECHNNSTNKNANDMTDYTSENRIAGYTPVNDAHFRGQLVYEMYQKMSESLGVLSSGSLKSGLNKGPLKGQNIKLRVHYGNYIDNASWDGTYVNLGDGNDVFYPMVSLDIISHEVAHGFLEKYAPGYLYVDNAPSGSISEAFSDMAGEAAEYYFNGSNDWLHNQEGFIGQDFEAGRYFENPEDDGNSISSLRDYWNGMPTRYASGIFNKAFYHLVNDSEGRWNTLTAYQLFMVAADNYWSGNISFEDAAQAVIWAVEDLKISKFSGVTEEELKRDVVLAFAQVDIYTEANNIDYALFDYEILFDQVSLVNKSETSGSSNNWKWKIEGQNNNYYQVYNINSQTNVSRLLTNMQDGVYEATLSFIDSRSTEHSFTKVFEVGKNHCTPNVGSSVTGYITNVKVNGESIVGVTGDDKYTDYTSRTPFRLSSTDIEIELVPSSNRYSHSWSVWIDNNGDGDFIDDGEWLLAGYSSKEAVKEHITIPNSPGVVKRLRVASNYSGYPRPSCQYIASGEVEDYAITLSETIPVPTVEILSMENPNNSLNYSFDSDIQNLDDIESIQWLILDNSDQLIYDGDQASFSHTFEQAGSYTVHLMVNSDYTDELNLIVVGDTNGQNYCEPEITNASDLYIDRAFVWDNSNPIHRSLYYNDNGYSQTGYQFSENPDNGNPSQGGAPIIKGDEFSYYFEPPVDQQNTDYHWAMWIDENRNKVFEDSERVDMGNSSAIDVFFYHYTLPNDYPVGETRLRVRVSETEILDPCADASTGEVEDYLIRIE